MEKTTIRQQLQEVEKRELSSHAFLSINTAGRVHPQEECPLRTPFQRDRDRIVHCKAFRRLMHKTQVFLFPQGDHYRTRLTHTLEVTQVARTIARGLRLNEDLTEAISMGHDLGHTPFGHAGEHALRDVSPFFFRHSEQSLRVVELLERGGQGLNLTAEVREGILGHSDGMPWAATWEGQVVRFADKIAYINHDIEDAIRAGILTQNDIPWEVRYKLGQTKSQRITTLIHSLVENSREEVGMAPEIIRQYTSLKAFLFETVYKDPVAKGEESKAKDIVRKLYDTILQDPDKLLPSDYHSIWEQEGVERAVCDYIAGMSDRYCVAVFEGLFIPRPWGV